MVIAVFSLLIKMELLRRSSLGLALVQTLHGQAIIGTPEEVPVPRNVIFMPGK
jgi:hypothetical protein